MFGARQRVFAPAFHAADLFAGEAFAKDVFPHQVLLCGKQIGLVFDLFAEVAQNFHRALIGDVRPRRVGEPVVAVDHNVLDLIGRQQGGGCRPRRSSAND